MDRKSTLRIASLGVFVLLAACTRINAGAGQEPQARGIEAGVPDWFYQAISWLVAVVEAIGVLVILLGILLGAYYYLRGFFAREDTRLLYNNYREQIGRAILLGLEFLVAADIINTVSVRPTFENLGILGFIVLIRTFLSFAIEVEIHGRWPWQSRGGQDQVEHTVQNAGEGNGA